MVANMSFVVLTCPKCGNRILMDEKDGKGFCMYCGNPIAAEDTDAEFLDSQSESLIEIIIGGGESAGSESRPWFGLMADSVDHLMAGDAEEAGRSFAEAIEGQDPEVQMSMKDAMAEAVAQWILRTVYDGGSYHGGLMSVAPLLEVDGIADTVPSVLIETIMEALCNSKSMVQSADDAYNMVESAYILMTEYFLAEPAITNQAIVIDEFIREAGEFMEVVAGISKGDIPGVRSSMECMRRATESIQAAMAEAISSTDQERIDGLELYWGDKGIDRIGKDASDILMRVYDDSFEDTDPFWTAMDDDAKGYVHSYFHPGI